MYDYVQISTINDFIFCQRSLYFHSIYYTFVDKQYKAKPQVAGTIAHEATDTGRYSSQKKFLQAMEVFSHAYGVIGKIDVYDKETKVLTERKRKINRVYDGYRFQLYAQKLALEEMGFPVEKMFLHSLSDNKKYEIHFHGPDLYAFEKTIEKIRAFNVAKSSPKQNIQKCRNCIYRELCRREQ